MAEVDMLIRANCLFFFRRYIRNATIPANAIMGMRIPIAAFPPVESPPPLPDACDGATIKLFTSTTVVDSDGTEVCMLDVGLSSLNVIDVEVLLSRLEDCDKVRELVGMGEEVDVATEVVLLRVVELLDVDTTSAVTAFASVVIDATTSCTFELFPFVATTLVYCCTGAACVGAFGVGSAAFVGSACFCVGLSSTFAAAHC